MEIKSFKEMLGRVQRLEEKVLKFDEELGKLKETLKSAYGIDVYNHRELVG